MPKSATSTPGGISLAARRLASATPNPSSPRKTLPIPATRTRVEASPGPAGPSGSTSSGSKKKRWPGWRWAPRSRPGSSSTTTASLRSPSMSCSTFSTTAVRPARAPSKTSPPVRGRSRTLLPRRTSTPPISRNPDRGARAPPRGCRTNRREQGLVLPAASSGLPRHAKLADRPCRRSSSSSESASVRSRISRALGSVRRISSFSSSERARMLRVRSWSISPPSKRSPGLSSATLGWSGRMIGEASIVPAPRVPRPAPARPRRCHTAQRPWPAPRVDR